MGALFSGLWGEDGNAPPANTPTISNQDNAILELKTQRDQLKRYIKKGNEIIEKEVVMARKLALEGKRDKAKICLQKKKFQEASLAKAEQIIANVEELVNTIEFTQIQKNVFDGLKQGSVALKALQKEMSLDDVEDLLLDTEEAVEHQAEVSRMLSEKLTDEDEADILEELAALSDENVELPDVPRHPVVASAPQPAAAKQTKQPNRQRTAVPSS